LRTSAGAYKTPVYTVCCFQYFHSTLCLVRFSYDIRPKGLTVTVTDIQTQESTFGETQSHTEHLPN